VSLFAASADYRGSAACSGAAMSDPVADAIVKAVTEVLEALATLAMETRMFPRNFAPLVDAAFVRAVDREAERRGQPPPDVSTVAARTGLHRNLVARIRSNSSPNASIVETRLPQTLRVLRDWMTDSDYLDEHNQPKVLPLRGPVSFNELAKRQGAGLRPRSILNELLRMKAVRLVGSRHVEMLNRAELNPERKAQAIRDLGEFGTECLETLIQRVINCESPRFYRRVVGMYVDTDEVPKLVRDASSQANAWAVGVEDAFTDRGVTVAPQATPQSATQLSAHFFIAERLTVVPAIAKRNLRPNLKSRAVKRRR
jgi:Family of unknown function (DUF6502)